MGFLHAAYGTPNPVQTKTASLTEFSTGAGALASPLVATQFYHMRHWSFHFLVSLGIAISNTIVLSAVFRLKTQDGNITHLLPRHAFSSFTLQNV